MSEVISFLSDLFSNLLSKASREKKWQMKDEMFSFVKNVYWGASRAHARTRITRVLHFLLSQPSQKSLQQTVIEWVIAIFSQFLRVESFFIWRASLLDVLKYVLSIWIFYCFSGGYEEICEGCESKKSKILYVRACARSRARKSLF